MPHIHELYDFTASAHVLHPTEAKVCLHLHKKHGTWMQPGGHIELDEDPLTTIVRELEEETGLRRTDYEFIERTDQPKAKKHKYIPLPLTINTHQITDKHTHIDIVFLVKSKIIKLKPAPGESQEINWFSKDELTKLHKTGHIYPGIYQTCLWILNNLTTIDNPPLTRSDLTSD